MYKLGEKIVSEKFGEAALRQYIANYERTSRLVNEMFNEEFEQVGEALIEILEQKGFDAFHNAIAFFERSMDKTQILQKLRKSLYEATRPSHLGEIVAKIEYYEAIQILLPNFLLELTKELAS